MGKLGQIPAPKSWSDFMTKRQCKKGVFVRHRITGDRYKESNKTKI